MKWFHARTIVQEHKASLEADKLARKFPRFEEAYAALQWLLARSANKVPALHREFGDDTFYLYRQASDDLADTPAIVVVYQYDDDEVNIIALHAENVDEPDE